MGRPFESYAGVPETYLRLLVQSGPDSCQTFRTRGDVNSKNQAIYIQDKWQPTGRLTLNLGLRTESEDVPSYAPGLTGNEI